VQAAQFNRQHWQTITAFGNRMFSEADISKHTPMMQQ